MVKELVEHIVKHVVEKPDVVRIETITEGEKTVMQVRVASQDLARIIGNEGRTFRALRTVVNLLVPGTVQDMVADIAE